jgi:hypothetical protein
MAADWDIKEMTMWKIIPNDDHKQFQVYFPFNNWLGKKVSTLKAKGEIYQSTDHHLRGKFVLKYFFINHLFYYS